MQLRWTVPLVAAAAFLLVLAVVADPALAAPAKDSAASSVGGNFGDFIRDNFIEITIAVAGVIAIAAIAKRDVVLGLVVVGVTILVLGFFVKPSPYQTIAEKFLSALSGATILPL